METLLILGDKDDAQVQSLLSHIRMRVVFFNSDTVDDFTFTRSVNHNLYSVTYKGHPFVPTAIFWRCVFYHDFVCEKDNTNNWEAYFNLFTEAFPDAVWFNSPRAFKEHQTKLPQLRKVINWGVRTPETLVTNNIDDALVFLKAHKTIAIKPVCGGDYTQRCKSKKKLKKIFSEHKQPLCLQRFIKGENVRVYVVGTHTYATVMPANGAPDFRTVECTPVPVQLNEDFLLLNRDITSLLGLQWTAIDWVERKGKYYFLEANFSPMFANFEYMTGYPIGETLANCIEHVARC